MRQRVINLTKVFKEKNYFYYFSGQLLSLIGTWMQSTALGWLVYRLTNSSKILGFMGFLNMLPPLIFSYIGGVIADRIELKKGLYITQSIAMFFAFLLGILVVTNKITVHYILIIGFIMGVVGSFDMPFRQSFVINIVPKNLLSNAIALNSTMFNISRMIGPAIAGFIIKYLNEGWCFILNGISYIFIIIALFYIKPYSRVREKVDIKKSFKAGIEYILNTDYIKYPILFMFLLSFIIMPVITLMPVYVKKMNGTAQMLGFLMTSIGMGAALSGFEMASKKTAKNYLKMINTFSMLYGLSLILLSLNKYIYFSYIILFFAGVGTSRQAVGINTIIQTLVKDEMRGRVISIYSLSFMGLAPLGNIFWGYLTDKIGISKTLFLCGLWIIIVNIWFLKSMYKIRDDLKTNPQFEIL